jgi:hypothetical protein
MMAPMRALARWLDRVGPGVHRRVKGLRLITAYGGDARGTARCRAWPAGCGAYAFTLIVTLAAGGERSIPLLAARAWETLVGGALGLTAALLLFPIRAKRDT